MKTILRLAAAACVATAIGLGSARAQHELKIDEFPTSTNSFAKTADDHYREALQFKRERKFEQAKQAVLQALKIDRSHKLAIVEAAWFLNEDKEYETAKQAANRALQIDNAYAPAWRELGYACLRQKNYEEAAGALLKSLQHDPNDKNTLLYAAELMDATNYPDAARNFRTKAGNLN